METSTEKTKKDAEIKTAGIEDIPGFQGYYAYMETLLEDEFLGQTCTYEEAERILTPANHGCDLSTLYTDYEKFGE